MVLNVEKSKRKWQSIKRNALDTLLIFGRFHSSRMKSSESEHVIHLTSEMWPPRIIIAINNCINWNPERELQQQQQPHQQHRLNTRDSVVKSSETIVVNIILCPMPTKLNVLCTIPWKVFVFALTMLSSAPIHYSCSQQPNFASTTETIRERHWRKAYSRVTRIQRTSKYKPTHFQLIT